MKKITLVLLFFVVQFISSQNCTNSTTWDGNGWSNGFPDSSINAIIDGSYDTGNDGSIDCCSLFVTNQGYLTVNLGDYCNVYSNINVDTLGTLLVKSGASLIPNNNNSISNGTVKVERRTPTLKRYDYTYWSSPVSTTIGGAFPVNKWEPLFTFRFNTPTYYDVETSYWGTFLSNVPDGQDDNQDAWVRTNIADPMIPGKGYASMVFSLDGTGTFPRTETVLFAGNLHTGIINIPLEVSQNTLSDIDDFNLVGNPYSSSINSNDLIDQNLSNISGTLYFWTHTNTLSTSYSGLAMYNYSTNDYAKYTKLGGVTAIFGGKKPSNVIGSCQGFLVEAESTNNLVFSPNLMSKAYVNTTPVAFFKTSERNNSRNKRNIWLNMSNDELFSQQLIGYNSSSTLGYNKGWDSRIINTRLILKFYSIEDDVKYDIQARGQFDDDDTVKLGYFSAIDGEFTISIDDKIGRFGEGVYLFDRSFGIWHDLSEPYTFTTTSGSFDSRFFIRYKSPEYEDEDDKKVGKEFLKVDKIDVYDLFGRKIEYSNYNSLEELPIGQILILKIYQGEEIITKKYFRE